MRKSRRVCHSDACRRSYLRVVWSNHARVPRSLVFAIRSDMPARMASSISPCHGSVVDVVDKAKHTDGG